MDTTIAIRICWYLLQLHGRNLLPEKPLLTGIGAGLRVRERAGMLVAN